jgi:hypothetical protein
MAFRPASFDGVVAFYVVNHLPQEELAPTFERTFAWLRPGGRQSGERLLRETGFHLEISDVRQEGVDDGYGPVESHWVIARKPEPA